MATPADEEGGEAIIKPVSSLRTHFERLQTPTTSIKSSPIRARSPESFSAIAASIAARTDGFSRAASEFASPPASQFPRPSQPKSLIPGPSKPKPIPGPKPVKLSLPLTDPLINDSSLSRPYQTVTGADQARHPIARPPLRERATSPTIPTLASTIPPIPLATKPRIPSEGIRTSLNSAPLAKLVDAPISIPPEATGATATATIRTAPAPPPSRKGGTTKDGALRPSAAEAELMTLMPPSSDETRHESLRNSPFSTPPGSSGGEDDRSRRDQDSTSKEKLENQSTRSSSARSSVAEDLEEGITDEAKLIDLPLGILPIAIAPPTLPPRREPQASNGATPRQVPPNFSSLTKSMTQPGYPTASSSSTSLRNAANTQRNLAVASAKHAFTPPSTSPWPSHLSSGLAATGEQVKSIGAPAQARVPDADSFPDYSRSRRGPPLLPDGPREDSINFDTKMFASGGRHICAGAFQHRAWEAGRIDTEKAPRFSEDGIKVTAICAKPGSDLESLGDRFWMGTNVGNMYEISARTGQRGGWRPEAHGRADIVKLHVCHLEVWSIDIDARLLVWSPRGSEPLNIEHSPASVSRLPKPHNASAVVKGLLWYASGRDIRVVDPHKSRDQRFDVVGKALSTPFAGIVTNIVRSGPLQDQVFVGNSEGKVSIYGASSYECLGTVTLTQGRLGAMSAINGDLWVGFNTGSIYVYDTTQRPWRVKKDWSAHNTGVAQLELNEIKIYQTGQCEMISIGAGNKLKFWDALVKEDATNDLTAAAKPSFTTAEKITCSVATWNAGATGPDEVIHESQSNPIVDSVLSGSSCPDILVFGLQELVDLEDTRTTALSFFSSKRRRAQGHDHVSRQYSAWREHLQHSLHGRGPGGDEYMLLKQDSLVGLFSAVFVRSSLRNRITQPDTTTVKRGVMGLHGNKGAIVIRFLIDDSSICLVNTHLAAGQKEVAHRKNDLTAILEHSGLEPLNLLAGKVALLTAGGDGRVVLDHDIVILNGDLNYRLDSMSRELIFRTLGISNSAAATISAVVSTELSPKALDVLLRKDQLKMAVSKDPQFKIRAFNEGNITFAPTYKYDLGTDRYDNSEKKRPPAYCDRILYRGADVTPNRQSGSDSDWYRRVEGIKVSDHRPVIADFILNIQKVKDWSRYEAIREDAERSVGDAELKTWAQYLLRYLKETFGFDEDQALEVVRAAGNLAEMSAILRRLTKPDLL